MRPLRFLMVLLIPLATVTGWLAGGMWVWLGLGFVFIGTPIGDWLLGKDPDDAPESEADRPIYRLILWVWGIAQFGLGVWALSNLDGRSATELAGMAMTWGVVSGGVGITVAHELMHRRALVDRGLAEALLLSTAYPHFCIEHVLGHHKNVATPDDAASALRGQSLYAYLPVTLLGGLKSAWRLETERVQRLNIGLGLRDRRVRQPLLLALLVAGIAAGFGAVALTVWFGQAVMAVLLLEVINYVEHYGLRRKRRGDRYEPVGAEHSWSAPQRLSCWYLFNLPRHADHHFRAHRPYAVLRHLENSPELPAGYPSMLLLALVPPLWFRTMNPRVDALSQPPASAVVPDGDVVRI